MQDIEKNNNTTARNISMVKTTTLQLKRNLKYNLKQQELSLVSEVDLKGEMGGGEGLTQLIFANNNSSSS